MISSRGITAGQKENWVHGLRLSNSLLGNLWKTDSSKKLLKICSGRFSVSISSGKRPLDIDNCFRFALILRLSPQAATCNSSLFLIYGQLVISDPRFFSQFFRYGSCVITLVSSQKNGVGRNAVKVNISGTDLVCCFFKNYYYIKAHY